jgi:serine/threonine protein kinase
MTGTPGWISPEHYRTGTVDPEGDVFAWGALVAYAATGRLPFGNGAAEDDWVVRSRAAMEGPRERSIDSVSGANAVAGARTSEAWARRHPRRHEGGRCGIRPAAARSAVPPVGELRVMTERLLQHPLVPKAPNASLLVVDAA